MCVWIGRAIGMKGHTTPSAFTSVSSVCVYARIPVDVLPQTHMHKYIFTRHPCVFVEQPILLGLPL